MVVAVSACICMTVCLAASLPTTTCVDVFKIKMDSFGD